jgi:hypothetical protein
MAEGPEPGARVALGKAFDTDTEAQARVHTLLLTQVSNSVPRVFEGMFLPVCQVRMGMRGDVLFDIADAGVADVADADADEDADEALVGWRGSWLSVYHLSEARSQCP